MSLELRRDVWAGEKDASPQHIDSFESLLPAPLPQESSDLDPGSSDSRPAVGQP